MLTIKEINDSFELLKTRRDDIKNYLINKFIVTDVVAISVYCVGLSLLLLQARKTMTKIDDDKDKIKLNHLITIIENTKTKVKLKLQSIMCEHNYIFIDEKNSHVLFYVEENGVLVVYNKNDKNVSGKKQDDINKDTYTLFLNQVLNFDDCLIVLQKLFVMSYDINRPANTTLFKDMFGDIGVNTTKIKRKEYKLNNKNDVIYSIKTNNGYCIVRETSVEFIERYQEKTSDIKQFCVDYKPLYTMNITYKKNITTIPPCYEYYFNSYNQGDIYENTSTMNDLDNMLSNVDIYKMSINDDLPFCVLLENYMFTTLFFYNRYLQCVINHGVGNTGKSLLSVVMGLVLQLTGSPGGSSTILNTEILKSKFTDDIVGFVQGRVCLSGDLHESISIRLLKELLSGEPRSKAKKSGDTQVVSIHPPRPVITTNNLELDIKKDYDNFASVEIVSFLRRFVFYHYVPNDTWKSNDTIKTDLVTGIDDFVSYMINKHKNENNQIHINQLLLTNRKTFITAYNFFNTTKNEQKNIYYDCFKQQDEKLKFVEFAKDIPNIGAVVTYVNDAIYMLFAITKDNLQLYKNYQKTEIMGLKETDHNGVDNLTMPTFAKDLKDRNIVREISLNHIAKHKKTNVVYVLQEGLIDEYKTEIQTLKNNIKDKPNYTRCIYNMGI